MLFQAQPCVSVYLLCVPAEPPRPDILCLPISCKFEFDLVGWSPGGLLAAFEIVTGSERSLMHGAVWSRRGAGRGSGEKTRTKENGKGEEKCGDNKGENPERRGEGLAEPASSGLHPAQCTAEPVSWQGHGTLPGPQWHSQCPGHSRHSQTPSFHFLYQGIYAELSIPSPTVKLPPSRQQRQSRLRPPEQGSDLLVSSSSAI